jgi:intracellular sulfur oxidation DsrE/DsrF family protein
MPDAAVQPEKGRTYRVVINLSQAAPAPNQVLDGLEHAARLLNVFAVAGVPLTNLKAVAIFHAGAAYAAMRNDVYRRKFHADNPNAELIGQLKAAGVEMLFCGQTLHDLKLNSDDLLPEMKVATSGAVVLVTYQNDGYALLPF